MQLKLTWRFGLYMAFMGLVMFFIVQALLNTYDFPLNVFGFILVVYSYAFSIVLIRKTEGEE